MVWSEKRLAVRCPKPEILPAAPRLRANPTDRNARQSRLRVKEWGAFDCAVQQSQPASALIPMNRSPSAISSSTIHRSGSRALRRCRYSVNSNGFSASCVLVADQMRPPVASGIRSKRRTFPPLSAKTTRIVPASRSPLLSTAAKPPAASTMRIRPATSRWAGSRVITQRPFQSSQPVAHRAPQHPVLRPTRHALLRCASAG